MTRWVKAGVRRDPADRERRQRELRAEAAHRNSARLADEQEAYRRWRAGQVVPHRITTALDARGLDGPEVDSACRAEEPEVDQWEAGERYPSWEQLVALAELTGMTARYFTFDDPPLPWWATSMRFHMSSDDRRAAEREPGPLMRYPRAVLDSRPAAPEQMPTRTDPQSF
jgi:hypothetical protein